MQHNSISDTVTGIGAGVTVAGTTVSIAAFFAAYNPIFIGLATLISIVVGCVTLYYKVKNNGSN